MGKYSCAGLAVASGTGLVMVGLASNGTVEYELDRIEGTLTDTPSSDRYVFNLYAATGVTTGTSGTATIHGRHATPSSTFSKGTYSTPPTLVGTPACTFGTYSPASYRIMFGPGDGLKLNSLASNAGHVVVCTTAPGTSAGNHVFGWKE